ncbi:astacin-like metalloprotease toxin 2 [Choristoneura fumiferana]|uniref:astacin-like metalloprotease toxin 2 n=1 Tax=Choristoneura fumiferana TaxID=7141 RepID=UPI003D15450D
MTSPLANPEENSGKYQGDIVLDDFIIDGMLQEYAQGRNAYTWPNTKWPNDTVVWEFGEGEFGPLQSAAIEEGIADIERHTCIKFRYREPSDTAFVRLTVSDLSSLLLLTLKSYALVGGVTATQHGLRPAV